MNANEFTERILQMVYVRITKIITTSSLKVPLDSKVTSPITIKV